MSSRDKHFHPGALVIAATGVVSAIYILNRYRHYLKKIKPTGFFKRPCEIHVVDNKDDCVHIVKKLKSSCSHYRVLGFDCEWLTVNGSRHPIALLQLASYDGLCALFRLSKLKAVPHDLREILEDPTILKVGIAPIDDARYLMHDYAVNVKATLDLRYLAVLAHKEPQGLAAMSKSLLNVELDKAWRVRCSDWAAEELTNIQVNYAAKDALVAVQIFKKLEEDLSTDRSFSWFGLLGEKKDWDSVYNRCKHYTNMKFKSKHTGDTGRFGSKKDIDPSFHNLLSKHQQESLVSPSSHRKVTSRKYSITTRTKPLYHNCFLEAPDGELLCTCDTKKAQWYVDKGIGEMVEQDPYTVRLKFEPSGRSVGSPGHFYKVVKENRCVVCAKADSYIRKNVIPREYRKKFPAIMKDHSSHDVLLLCANCHQLSNLADQNLRMELAAIINEQAPKFVEDPKLKKIRSAARALLNRNKGKYNLPSSRVTELENIIRSHYVDCTDITEAVLKEAADVSYMLENESFESHGEKVVEYYQSAPGGLLQFEKLWRMHFLTSMAPKYMPPLWSVDHNKERLEIRKQEGRIDDKDVILSGLNQ